MRRPSAGRFNLAVWSGSNSISPTMSGDGRHRRVAQRKWELGKGVVVVLGKLDPGPDLRRIDGQIREHLALLKAEIVKTAGIRQGHGLPGQHQRGIHAVRLQHGDPDQCRVAVDVIDAGIEIEVILGLDNSERKQPHVSGLGMSTMCFWASSVVIAP